MAAVGEILELREELALQHDCRVREIDRIVRESWSELATLCILVRDNREWELLASRPMLDVDGKEEIRGYHSFDEWLADACPCCRSTVYAGMGVLSVLAKDVAPEDIAGMELGNAKILAHEVSSSAVRRDPEVIAAAKSGRHTKTLRTLVMNKYPDQLLEDVIIRKLRFPVSAWERIEAAYEAYRLVNGSASMESFLEFIVVEWEQGQ
jgi:hypothetical protein